MSKEKNSFIFYRSFYEAIETLSEDEQLVLFKAICDLALNNNERDLKGTSKGMYALIKPQILANNERYENGKKGGRPRKIKTNGLVTKKPMVSESEKPLKPLGTRKEKPNVNENVNKNE